MKLLGSTDSFGRLAQRVEEVAEMQKRAPTLANILVIVLFALSCFGLLLFLWESFGGPVPLKPKGYRFTIAFQRTLALAEQSDVRISGVNVGHVISLKYNKDGLAHATIEIASKYAPIPSNMHAILRQKTLLGETYVQLKPEGTDSHSLPDGGELPEAQVEPSVTLDDILSAFNPQTRAGLPGVDAVAGRRSRRSRRRDQLVIRDHPTVRRRRQQARHRRQLPGGGADGKHPQHGCRVRRADRARGTVPRLDLKRRARLPRRCRSQPGVRRNVARTARLRAQLSDGAAQPRRLRDQHRVRCYDSIRPFEEKLTPLLEAVKPFTPPFNALLTNLGPLAKAAKMGLPDVKKVTELTVPMLAASSPVLHNFNPFFQYASDYVPELQALFANGTAATQTHEKNTKSSKVPRSSIS